MILGLRAATSPAWVECVTTSLDAFLVDHAACERKASATALTLSLHYPDKPDLVREAIAMAQEELAHYAQVQAWVHRRGKMLGRDEKDPYVGALRTHFRQGAEAYFLDRLLLGAVVEARGCERFGLVAQALAGTELGDFYLELTRSESRHHGLFIRLARRYFTQAEVDTRLDEWLAVESAVVTALPIRAALH